jgi:hypothetical protein
MKSVKRLFKNSVFKMRPSEYFKGKQREVPDFIE